MYKSRMVGRAVVALVLMAVGGCDDPVFDHGTPPPIVLSDEQVSVSLDAVATGPILRARMMALAPTGDTARLRAQIQTGDASKADLAHQLLVQLGIDPVRISIVDKPAEVIVITRTDATTSSCKTALAADGNDDVSQSIGSVGTCVQANSLAEMLADPRDLAAPLSLAPADGEVSVSAINKWERGAAEQSSPSNPDFGEDGGEGTPMLQAVQPDRQSPSTTDVNGNPVLFPAPGTNTTGNGGN
jgi:type IV pilus biogenesis protein CpaD/CtpE